MQTTAEKRFIQEWQVQREGPRWKYYLQYIMAWSTVGFLALFFLTKLIMSDRNMGGWSSFYLVVAAAVLLAVLITHITYTANEKKFRKILENSKEEAVK